MMYNPRQLEYMKVFFMMGWSIRYTSLMTGIAFNCYGSAKPFFIMVCIGIIIGSSILLGLRRGSKGG